MAQLKFDLETTLLVMNDFPGWKHEEDWLKVFRRKGLIINSLWLSFYSRPKSLKIKSSKTSGYCELAGGGDLLSLPISKDALVKGSFEVTIDQANVTASVLIGGRFVINTDQWEAAELKAIESATHLFANLFSFSKPDGTKLSAQGCFTDSWDHSVPIRFTKM